MSLGVLVLGGNHLILSGPEPGPLGARRLARRLGMERVTIGGAAAVEHGPWRIETRTFRERLEWAVALEAEEPWSAAVTALLGELAARGVAVRRETKEDWEGELCD